MLKEKTALVTGSTRGLGEATAKALAAEGCDVMLNGFGEADEIERLRASIETTHGVRARHNGADLADADALDGLVAATEAELGPVDILVNNAVIRYFHSIESFDRKDWQHAIAVNLTAPFFLIQNVLGGMRARGWGRIVNISSVLGLAARGGRVDYVTCKTGLLGLMRTTAAEIKSEANVTCCDLSGVGLYAQHREEDQRAGNREGTRFRCRQGDFPGPARRDRGLHAARARGGADRISLPGFVPRHYRGGDTDRSRPLRLLAGTDGLSAFNEGDGDVEGKDRPSDGLGAGHRRIDGACLGRAGLQHHAERPRRAR
jgi:3-hydroxybutyrate dehydrogenase